MDSYSSPFSYFVFLHWSFFTFSLVVYITTWSITHFRVICDKW